MPWKPMCSECFDDGHEIYADHTFFPGFDGGSEVCIGWRDDGVPSCGGKPCPVCDGGWRADGSQRWPRKKEEADAEA